MRPKLTAEQRDARRGEILAASAKVFATKGYHAASIADIAAELGMGHGTFYRFFDNKLEIFREVIRQTLTEVAMVIGDEDPGSSGTLDEYREQTLRIARRLFELFQENVHVARLLFLEAPGIDPALNRELADATDLMAGFTALYLENGKKRRFLRKDLDVPRTAMAINAMIFEVARRLVAAKNPRAENRRWLAAFVALMFDGLRPR